MKNKFVVIFQWRPDALSRVLGERCRRWGLNPPEALQSLQRTIRELLAPEMESQGVRLCRLRIDEWSRKFSIIRDRSWREGIAEYHIILGDHPELMQTFLHEIGHALQFLRGDDVRMRLWEMEIEAWIIADNLLTKLGASANDVYASECLSTYVDDGHFDELLEADSHNLSPEQWRLYKAFAKKYDGKQALQRRRRLLRTTQLAAMLQEAAAAKEEG